MDSDNDEVDRVNYLPESFFVNTEEARGQVEDCIECGKVVLLASAPSMDNSCSDNTIDC